VSPTVVCGCVELGASVAVAALDVTVAGAVVAPHAATTHVTVMGPNVRLSGVMIF
jgi:hypothetical protein